MENKLFKNKVIILCGLAVILLVSYILTFVLSSTERANRGAQWSPLSEKSVANADKIEIKWEAEGEGNSLQFVKVTNEWFIQIDGNNYPARSARIDDLFSALTKKAPYFVHSRSTDSYAKFNVGDDATTSINIKQGDVVLLTLYIGNADASGTGIYIRKSDEDAVRSGADIFTIYTSGERNVWCDTRLFPDHDAAGLSVDAVQRIRVIPPSASATDDEGAASPIKASAAYSIVRDGSAWKFEGATDAVDASTVDSSLRFMLDSGGEDFVTAINGDDAAFAASNATAGRVVFETGDGKTYSAILGPKIDDKYTSLSTSGYVVSLSNWTVSRFWCERADYVAK